MIKESLSYLRCRVTPSPNFILRPIEHRLFPHVTRACQGVIFTSVELVKELMEKTHTQTGLKAFVHIIDKLYHTGRKVATDFKENMTIKFDQLLPKWNYTAVPNG